MQDKKAKKDKKSKKKKLDASKYSPAELEMYFQGLFKVADANGDGVLELDELTTLLKLCGFDLSAKEIEDFVNAADTNHDGVIEYDEFVPVATKMLKSKKGSKVSATVVWKQMLFWCYLSTGTEHSMCRASLLTPPATNQSI